MACVINQLLFLLDIYLGVYNFISSCSMLVLELPVEMMVIFVIWLFLLILICMTRTRRKVYTPVESDFFEPEKMKSGSPLVAAKAPNFQAEVYGIIGNNKYRAGQCFRVGNRLLTAAHVIEDYDTILIESMVGNIELAVKAFSRAHGDIAMISYDDVLNSALHLKTAILMKEIPEDCSGLFAMVTAFGKSSIGFLSAHRSFGFVAYTGSTVSGFSGAPYYSGNKVFGMHLGGSSENLGYDSAYLYCVLRRGLESSEDYIYDKIVRNKKAFRWVRDPYHPEIYVVRTGRNYFEIEEDVMQALLNKVEASEEKIEAKYDRECDKELVRKYEDWSRVEFADAPEEVPAVNFRKDVAAGAVGPDIANQPNVRPQPSMKKKKPVSSKKDPILTDGQQQTLARRNGVLDAIAKSMKKLRQQQHSLNVESSRKSLSTPRRLSAITQLSLIEKKLAELISIGGSLDASPI